MDHLRQKEMTDAAAAIAAQTAGWKPHPRIRLDKINWDAAAEADFRRIPNDCPLENAGLIRELVRENRAQALAVTHDGENAGTVIASIQDMGYGTEFIIWCAYLRAKTPVSAPVMQSLLDIAAANGCRSVRFSTIHAGLARWMEKQHGFRASEIIMRKDL
jgi:hypothetical protein